MYVCRRTPLHAGQLARSSFACSVGVHTFIIAAAVVVVAGKSKARAFFTAPPAKVSICEEHFRDNVDELREAVQHELTHAYDVWLPRSNWPPLSSADRVHCLLFVAHVCVCVWWLQHLVDKLDMCTCEGLACR